VKAPGGRSGDGDAAV